jgi:hypothetical protein
VNSKSYYDSIPVPRDWIMCVGLLHISTDEKFHNNDDKYNNRKEHTFNHITKRNRTEFNQSSKLKIKKWVGGDL